MLGDLERFAGGERAAAEVLGVSVITERSWMHRRTMAIPSRRAIWLTWVLLFHPERIGSGFDLLTWGRFKGCERPKRVRPSVEVACEDWSI